MLDGLSSAIASASAMQQEKANMEVQMGVLKKSMQVQKEVGEMLVGLISQAAGAGNAQTPGKAVGLGSNIDVSG